MADTTLLTETIERLFFAYRDFTSEADSHLKSHNLGRAHHRVIYFVTRHPGLAVHDLLEILQITKQSLSRVLGQLIRDGYVEQHQGPTDRRERLLYPSEAGADLARALTELQMRQVNRAFSEAGPEAARHVTAFLAAMVADTDRSSVEALISSSRHNALDEAPGTSDTAASPRAQVSASAPRLQTSRKDNR